MIAPDRREGVNHGRFNLGVLDAAVPLCLLVGGGLRAVSDVAGTAVGLLGVVLLPLFASWPLLWAGHALASWGAPREPARRELAHALVVTVFPTCCALALIAVATHRGVALPAGPLMPRTGWAGIAGTLWVLLGGLSFAVRTRRPGPQNG